MKNEKFKLILKLIINSLLLPAIGAIVYAAIYKIDLIMFFAAYIVIVVPMWLILSNIKLILNLNWRKTILICVYFSVIVVILGTLPLEAGAWFRNIGEFALEDVKETFEFVLRVTLPSNIIMTAIIIIIKVFYNLYKRKKERKLVDI